MNKLISALAAVSIAASAPVSLAPASSAMTGAAPAQANTLSNTTGQINANTTHCTATLISRDKAVTAAHCLSYNENSRGSVGFGTTGTTQRSTFSDSRIHPQADLAVVHLDRPVTGIAPVALATASPRSGSQGVGYGWGGVRGGILSTSPMQVVSENITLRYDTAHRSSSAEGVSANPVRSRAVIVAGDSGGPLFIGGRLAGVASLGSQKLNAIAYTKVSAYHGWLTRAINNQIAPSPGTGTGSLGS